MMMKQNCSLLRVLCLMLAALLLCGTALAEPRYPDKTADATDAALLLSADTLKDWNELATRVKSATGVRLYLATVDFLDGASLADYGAGLRSKWGLDDDSLLLLMAAGEDTFADKPTISNGAYQRILLHRFAINLKLYMDRRIMENGANQSDHIRKQPAGVLLGRFCKIQHHHIEACAADVQEHAVIQTANVNWARRMLQNKRKSLQRILGRFRCFDEIVSCAGRNHAQWLAGIHQPTRHFVGGAVAAYRKNGGAILLCGCLLSKLGSVSGAFRVAETVGNTTLFKFSTQLLGNFLRIAVSGCGLR